jgi:hypothetical protein
MPEDLKFREGWMLGHNLCMPDREHVLNAYTNRHTGDHYKSHCKYLHFKDDLDWLRNTYFRVTKKFRLDYRVNGCESYPTWPDNPELRKGIKNS